jgi:hypothetical protein
VEWVDWRIVIKFLRLIFNIIIYYKIYMGGGLLQLVAYGAQDIYLTGNPQITYFKTVFFNGVY